MARSLCLFSLSQTALTDQSGLEGRDRRPRRSNAGKAFFHPHLSDQRTNIPTSLKPVNPKGNQPCIFIGKVDAKVEAPVLWPLIRRTNSLEKTLMLAKFKSKRRGRQRMRWLNGIIDSMAMNLKANFRRQRRTRKPGMWQSMGWQSWTRLSNWLSASLDMHCLKVKMVSVRQWGDQRWPSPLLKRAT